jgi:hypothetical protein
MYLPIAAIAAEAGRQALRPQHAGVGGNQPRRRPRPDARTRTKASLDPRVTAHLLFANLETRSVGGDRAAVDDRLGLALWYELGCGVDAYCASPKALADRVTCAAPASAPALSLSRRSSHLAGRGLTAGKGKTGQSGPGSGAGNLERRPPALLIDTVTGHGAGAAAFACFEQSFADVDWFAPGVSPPRARVESTKSPSVSTRQKVPISRDFYGHGWARTTGLSRVKRYCTGWIPAEKPCKRLDNGRGCDSVKLCQFALKSAGFKPVAVPRGLMISGPPEPFGSRSRCARCRSADAFQLTIGATW